MWESATGLPLATLLVLYVSTYALAVQSRVRSDMPRRSKLLLVALPFLIAIFLVSFPIALVVALIGANLFGAMPSWKADRESNMSSVQLAPSFWRHRGGRKLKTPRPNSAEAEQLASEHAEALRATSYEDLRSRVPSTSSILGGALQVVEGSERRAQTLTGASGANYQVVDSIGWNDHDTGELIVTVTVDDGGLKLIGPATREFVVRPEEPTKAAD